MLKKLWSIVSGPHDPSIPLDMMDLGPTKNTENPVMVSLLAAMGPSNESLTPSTDPILYVGIQTPYTQLVEVL